MSLLNRPSDGMHSILVAIHNLLIQERAMELDTIIALCAPGDVGDSTQVRQTLNTWVKLGMFEKSADGKVSFHENVPKKDRSREELSKVSRGLVLRADNNTNLWAAEGVGSADFTRSVSWLLAQDVYKQELVSWSEAQALLQGQVPTGVTIIQNDTRWSGLKAWSQFLGFGWSGKNPSGVLIIDPTEAVRDALPGIFHKRSKLPAGDFITAISQSLPVVDGGSYRQELESKLVEQGVWNPPPDGCLSTSLSRAILRLIHEGVLKGESLADAGTRLRLTGRKRAEIESFSHISLIAN